MPLRIQSTSSEEGRTGVDKSLEVTETIMLSMPRALESKLAASRPCHSLGSDEHIRSISRCSSSPIVAEAIEAINTNVVQERGQTMGTVIKTIRVIMRDIISSISRSTSTFMEEAALARTRAQEFKRTMHAKFNKFNKQAETINWLLCWVNSMTPTRRLPKMLTTCSCSRLARNIGLQRNHSSTKIQPIKELAGRTLNTNRTILQTIPDSTISRTLTSNHRGTSEEMAEEPGAVDSTQGQTTGRTMTETTHQVEGNTAVAIRAIKAEVDEDQAILSTDIEVSEPQADTPPYNE